MASFISALLILIYFGVTIWVMIILVKLVMTLTDYLSTLTEEVRLRMARSAQENARRE